MVAHHDGRVDLGDRRVRLVHLLSGGRSDERRLQQRRGGRGPVCRRTLRRRHGLVHGASAVRGALERRRPNHDGALVHEVQLTGVHADERVHPAVRRRRRVRYHRVGRRVAAMITGTGGAA